MIPSLLAQRAFCIHYFGVGDPNIRVNVTSKVTTTFQGLFI